MKGIICDGSGGPEVLKLADVPDPVLKAGDVLIEVKATALNGADVMQRMGRYPPPPGASQLLGLEACGVILETGEGATRFKAGDKVIALLDGGGPLRMALLILMTHVFLARFFTRMLKHRSSHAAGYAEKVAAPEGYVMPLPKGLSWEQGAAIPETWITAYLELVMLGELKRDQAVLIHAGASGVGAAAIQIAKDIGAEVFVTASSSEKLQFCKDLGADHLINYKEQEDWAQVVKDSTTAKSLPAVPGGATKAPGVDVILDLVGASHFAKNIDALSLEGRLLLVGLPGGIKAEINLAQVLMKRLRIIGSTLRARPKAQKIDIVSNFSQSILAKFDSGNFKSQVDVTFPLGEASKAHQYMADAKNKGKIILVT